MLHTTAIADLVPVPSLRVAVTITRILITPTSGGAGV
jgi:hypothetical protein